MLKPPPLVFLFQVMGNVNLTGRFRKQAGTDNERHYSEGSSVVKEIIFDILAREFTNTSRSNGRGSGNGFSHRYFPSLQGVPQSLRCCG